MSAVLTLRDAEARLGGRQVLNGVDLQVEAGELVAVVGPNGAGKSSLIKVFAGLLPLTKGVAQLQGDAVGTLSPRERAGRVAYLPQERHIAWNMPAVEVAALGAPFLTADEGLARARAALEAVEAGHLVERGVAEMSGGERARVLLARLLTTQAQALLVDEPIAGLDPEAQLMVMDVLAARARAGQAVLVSLHDLTLAARQADRIVVIDRGRILADAPPLPALDPETLRMVFGLEGHWLETTDGPVLVHRRRVDRVDIDGSAESVCREENKIMVDWVE